MTAVMEQARTPMRWIPTLYFVQGMQFFVVMLIAGLMFKNLGVVFTRRPGPPRRLRS